LLFTFRRDWKARKPKRLKVSETIKTLTSPVILSQNGGQPRTNCNRSKLKL